MGAGTDGGGAAFACDAGAGGGAFATCFGGSGGGVGFGGAAALGGGAGGMLCLGAGGSAALAAGAGGGDAGGRAGSPSGAFSSGFSGAMSTMRGSPFLAYSGAPRVLTQTSEPSKKMCSRTEQTTATTNARWAGSAGSGSLTIADYATLSIGAPHPGSQRAGRYQTRGTKRTLPPSRTMNPGLGK